MSRLVIILFSSAVLAFPVIGSYPNSENPRNVYPPPSFPQGNQCNISLFRNQPLESYDSVSNTSFSPTARCGYGPWNGVLLSISGRVKGLQFDRDGAFWINGVEFARLTTPEPTPAGIEWEAVLDVSEYQAAMMGPGPSVATLMIPNIVNKQYTGVLYLSVTITIFRSNVLQSPPPPPQVFSLAHPVAQSNPLGSLSLSGSTSLHVAIPRAVCPSSPGDSPGAIYLDLHSSGHGNEEFWYSNFGVGGAHRAHRVTITGDEGNGTAGLAVPFPVIYTGGVNPLLWRPLTGIQSFVVSPYRLDLTPLASSLCGKRISISVDYNSKKGDWIVDPVLIVYGTQANVSARTGALPDVPMEPAVTVTGHQRNPVSGGNATLWITNSSSVITLTPGTSASLSTLTYNFYPVDSSDYSVTAGAAQTLTESSVAGASVWSLDDHSFLIVNDFVIDKAAEMLYIHAFVNISLTRVAGVVATGHPAVPRYAIVIYHQEIGCATLAKSTSAPPRSGFSSPSVRVRRGPTPGEASFDARATSRSFDESSRDLPPISLALPCPTPLPNSSYGNTTMIFSVHVITLPAGATARDAVQDRSLPYELCYESVHVAINGSIVYASIKDPLHSSSGFGVACAAALKGKALCRDRLCPPYVTRAEPWGRAHNEF